MVRIKQLYWTTKEGAKLRPKDMSSSHRQNILRIVLNKVRAELPDRGKEFSDKHIISQIMNHNELIRLIGFEEGYTCGVIISPAEVLGVSNSSEARQLIKLLE